MCTPQGFRAVDEYRDECTVHCARGVAHCNAAERRPLMLSRARWQTLQRVALLVFDILADALADGGAASPPAQIQAEQQRLGQVSGQARAVKAEVAAQRRQMGGTDAATKEEQAVRLVLGSMCFSGLGHDL